MTGNSEIEDIVDTFPIADIAAAMDLPDDQVRAILRGGVEQALSVGGSIDNMRRVAAPTALLGKEKRAR